VRRPWDRTRQQATVKPGPTARALRQSVWEWVSSRPDVGSVVVVAGVSGFSEGMLGASRLL